MCNPYDIGTAQAIGPLARERRQPIHAHARVIDNLHKAWPREH